VRRGSWAHWSQQPLGQLAGDLRAKGAAAGEKRSAFQRVDNLRAAVELQELGHHADDRLHEVGDRRRPAEIEGPDLDPIGMRHATVDQQADLGEVCSDVDHEQRLGQVGAGAEGRSLHTVDRQHDACVENPQRSKGRAAFVVGAQDRHGQDGCRVAARELAEYADDALRIDDGAATYGMA